MSAQFVNEEPTCRGIWLLSAEDALIIANLCIRGELQIIRQRPALRRQHQSSLSRCLMLQSGNVIVWEDDGQGCSRSMRWVDKIPWSPSRKCVDGPFFYYVERRGPSARASGTRNASTRAGQVQLNQDWRDERPWEIHHYGSLINSHDLRPHGLIKKTWTITIPGESPLRLRIISYFKAQDVTSGAIRRPTEMAQSSLFQIPLHASIKQCARELAVESKGGQHPSESSSKTCTSSTSSSSSPEQKASDDRQREAIPPQNPQMRQLVGRLDDYPVSHFAASVPADSANHAFIAQSMHSVGPATTDDSQSYFASHQTHLGRLDQQESSSTEQIKYPGHHMTHAGSYHQPYASPPDSQPSLQSLHCEIALVPLSWQHQHMMPTLPRTPVSEHDHLNTNGQESQEDADGQEHSEL